MAISGDCTVVFLALPSFWGGFGFKSNDVSVDYNYGILYHGAIIAKFLSLS